MPRPHACGASSGEACLAPTQRQGTLTLGADAAETHGSRIKAEAKNGKPNLGFWDNAEDWAAWKADVKQAGTYEVSVTAAAAKGDSQFVVEVGPQQLAGKATQTEGWGKYQTTTLGKVEIKSPGEITIKVRPKDAATWKAINLTEVTLKKAP